MGFALLLLLMFGGRGQAAPSAFYIQMRVRGDAEGVKVLKWLDKVGKVVSMHNFDGKNLEVIWNEGASLHHGVARELDKAGVNLISMRPAKAVA